MEEVKIAGKQIKISVAILPGTEKLTHLFENLPVSRYGESSSELSSVMILSPTTGNSLEKAIVPDSKTSHE